MTSERKESTGDRYVVGRSKDQMAVVDTSSPIHNVIIATCGVPANAEKIAAALNNLEVTAQMIDRGAEELMFPNAGLSEAIAPQLAEAVLRAALEAPDA